MAKGQRRGAARKVSCDDCFFRQNLLCALDCDEPCGTFRPGGPDGLSPPRQLRFTFRQEQRTHAAWAFPSAQEQAALHTVRSVLGSRCLGASRELTRLAPGSAPAPRCRP